MRGRRTTVECLAVFRRAWPTGNLARDRYRTLSWGRAIFTTIDASLTHIRPRFKFSVPGSPAQVLARVRELLADSPPSVRGMIVGDHVILDIAAAEVHFWSPQLNFRVEEDEDDAGRTILAGLIGPRPGVWTLFMFGYFSVGIAGFFLTSYGISRYMVGDFSHAIWGLPLAALFMLTAYRAGKFGERLGADQVELLKDFIRQAVGPDRRAPDR